MSDYIKQLVSSAIHQNHTYLITTYVLSTSESLRNAIEDYENSTDKTIYEWWCVDLAFARQLQSAGEFVLLDMLGAWWGRTSSGQAIYMDDVFKEMEKQFYAKDI